MTVTSSANSPVTFLAVIGENPIGFSSQATSTPAQVVLHIPRNASFRTFKLTAIGMTASGQRVQSNPIEIDVERVDFPVKLSVVMPEVFFDGPGEQFPQKVLATFADDTDADITESSNLSYSSNNPDVATGDQYGMVTAHSPGKGMMTVTYRKNGHAIHVRFGFSVSPPGPSSGPPISKLL